MEVTQYQQEVIEKHFILDADDIYRAVIDYIGSRCGEYFAGADVKIIAIDASGQVHKEFPSESLLLELIKMQKTQFAKIDKRRINSR